MNIYTPLQLAKLNGQPRYHGRPCRKCGLTEKYTASSTCISCNKIIAAKSRANNRDKIIAAKKLYYNNNKKMLNDKSRTYYVENKDAIAKQSKNYLNDNKDKFAARNAKRRAAKLERCVPWADQKEITKIYEESKQKTDETGIIHHVDHIIPLQGKFVSGLHIHTNLQVITADENLAKHNSYCPEDN